MREIKFRAWRQVMTEPVAYLVSQEPLSSVRWLSDIKPIGVDNKQITPLYTALILKKWTIFIQSVK